MTASDEEFVVTILSDGRMDPVNGIQGMAIWRILNRGWVVTAEESQRGFAQLVIWIESEADLKYTVNTFQIRDFIPQHGDFQAELSLKGPSSMTETLPSRALISLYPWTFRQARLIPKQPI